jgi:dihydroxyacetone kinase-like protein
MTGGGPAGVDLAGVERWIREFARLVARDAAELTRLDAAIGDADHGTNMDRGLTAVVAALDEAAAQRHAVAGVGGLLARVGMTLVSTVGGASGPLFGTFFLRMATAAGQEQVLAPSRFAAALRTGLEGLAARGRAEPGDKTMVDALEPGCSALDAALAAGADLGAAVKAASAAAEAGRDATIPMLARKGRASYLGERSVGHQDPGATSAALMLRAAAEVLAG